VGCDEGIADILPSTAKSARRRSTGYPCEMSRAAHSAAFVAEVAAAASRRHHHRVSRRILCGNSNDHDRDIA
jgi:hypothetical protein